MDTPEPTLSCSGVQAARPVQHHNPRLLAITASQRGIQPGQPLLPAGQKGGRGASRSARPALTAAGTASPARPGSSPTRPGPRAQPLARGPGHPPAAPASPCHVAELATSFWHDLAAQVAHHGPGILKLARTDK